MYTTYTTFYGIPLSHKSFSGDLNFLKLVSFIPELGWSVQSLTAEIINEIASNEFCNSLENGDATEADVQRAISFLSFVEKNKDEFLKLDVDFNTEYSGGGDRPMYFGAASTTCDLLCENGIAEKHSASLMSTEDKNKELLLLNLFETMEDKSLLDILHIEDLLGLWTQDGTS